ncbi:Ribonuclease-like 3 [Channa argus]|uniref:Ribonuclease-like 3 n=1 Tax=Channa argus TaxID=215402 RepID=A0A6G1PUZ6_CHAAH|nr:Ribonuclease-like 3 [Channa argus]
MKIQFGCLLMLLLSATVLSQQGNERYRHFINQHINGGMRVSQCDAEIQRRRITETGTNVCKETNTFILASTSYVKNICEKAGEPYRGMRISLQPFSIIVCQLKNQGATRPNCQYRGQARTRKIVIACDQQGFPVHYAEDIVPF